MASSDTPQPSRSDSLISGPKAVSPSAGLGSGVSRGAALRPVLRVLARCSLLGVLLGLGSGAAAVPSASASCAPATDSTTAAMQAACCPGDLLSTYWPGYPPGLNQVLCQLLVFPTSTTLNGDFNAYIVDGSVSSDSRQASAEEMTLPSLWWNRDSLTNQLGGRRLVQSWISYQIKDSGTLVVDVMVNPQIWSVLTYTERFAVLNQFGTTARTFGYDLRFFQGNARNTRLLGIYACEPGDKATETPTLRLDSGQCTANLDMVQLVQMQRSLLAEGDRRQPPAANLTAESTPVQ